MRRSLSSMMTALENVSQSTIDQYRLMENPYFNTGSVDQEVAGPSFISDLIR